MRKKRILIVNKSFELGGIQSSMVNMANELSEQFEVHLFVYNPVGVMKERLSSSVRVIEPTWMFRCLGMSLKQAIHTKNPKMILYRTFATVWSRLFSNQFPIALAIKHQPKMLGYDLAIAYHQEQRKKTVVSGFARVVDKCVDAKIKAAWLHYDCTTIELDSAYNNPFYQKMDKIVCVSKSLMSSFAKANPDLSDKVEYCYNFIPYHSIKEKSLENQKIAYPSNRFICFSACRLTEEKALVRGIAAISDVLKMHTDVVWYIAGEGVERNNIENAIKAYGVEQQVVLLGHQLNPYPYMRNANLVMNLSYHEAAPMVFLESMALGVPVFATRTSSAEELLCDKKDSFVCDNSAEGIRDQFAWIVENKECVRNFRQRLVEYHASNEIAISKITKWIE